MYDQWILNEDSDSTLINMSDYTFVFTGISDHGQRLKTLLSDYLQPRSKIKNEIRITEATYGEEINHHHYYTVLLKGFELNQEEMLATKSSMKQQVKEKLLQQIEAQGYLLTINSLIEDYLKLIRDDFDLSHQGISVDDILKQSTLNLVHEGNEEDDYYKKYKSLISKMCNHLPRKGSALPLLILDHPENHLSSLQQINLREHLDNLSSETKIIVFSNSKCFIPNDLRAINVFSRENMQVISENLIENLEWNAPLNYKPEDLAISALNVLKHYIESFEVVPNVSNHVMAEVNLFSEVDIYVFMELMKVINLDYQLDIDNSSMSKVISKYINKHERR